MNRTNRFPFIRISTNVRQFHFTMLLPCHIYAIINQLSIRCDVRLNEEQFYKRNFNLVLKETIILLDNVILEISPGRSIIDRTIVKRNDVDRVTSNPSPYPSHPRLNLKINNCREQFLSFQRPGLLSPWKQPYILFTLVFHALRGNEKKQLVNLRSRLIPLKYPFLSSVSIGRWTWREATSASHERKSSVKSPDSLFMAGLKADAATRIDSARRADSRLAALNSGDHVFEGCSNGYCAHTGGESWPTEPIDRVRFLYWFFQWRMTSTIYLSLSTILITSLTLLNVMDAIWIAGAKILLWVMILPRGSREQVSLLNCVLFPLHFERRIFFFLFFRRISIQETGYDIEIFYFEVAQEKFRLPRNVSEEGKIRIRNERKRGFATVRRRK